MTRKDTLQLLTVIKQFWASFQIAEASENPLGGELPGTLDTWHMALVEFDVEDAIGAIEELTRNESLSGAPQIHDIKPRMIRLRRNRMTEAQRARAALEESGVQYASPEKVQEFWSSLKDVVERIGERQPKREVQKFITPPPNEDHDWEKTFGELDEIDRIMRTPPPPIGPKDFQKRRES